MSNKFKEIYIKTLTYYFLDDIINTKSFYTNEIKMKSHTKIFLFPTFDM